MNFNKKIEDYALYLPAISAFYTRQLAKYEDEVDTMRCPEGFENGLQGLNFLDEEKGYYYYPYGLYSAGHAQLDLDKTDIHERMIQKRDRSKTVILGDSGGFQIAKGVIKLDWEDAIKPDSKAREALCEKMLRWLEYTADWSMTLDFPAFAAIPPYNKKTGLTDVKETIDMSMYNLDYFVKNRVPGATKFLNVLSGADDASAQEWFDLVTPFSDPAFVKEHYGDEARTLEGYAMAGINIGQMEQLLKRLLQLREKGLLEGKGWIHCLGTGKLHWGCYLTSIQRQLRKHDSPNIQVSYDAASPFVNTAYGQTYTYNFFDKKRFGYFMDKAIDNKDLKGSTLPMPFKGPIMDRLTVGDICVQGHGDLNKAGKESRTSWDTLSYSLYMGHSVHNHIEAFIEANRLADVEKHRTVCDWREYRTGEKKTSSTNERSPHVPGIILMFDKFVEELLDPANPNPYKMLEDNKLFLDEITQNGWQAGKSNSFGSFFEQEEYIEGDRDDDMNHEIMTGEFDGEG